MRAARRLGGGMLGTSVLGLAMLAYGPGPGPGPGLVASPGRFAPPASARAGATDASARRAGATEAGATGSTGAATTTTTALGSTGTHTTRYLLALGDSLAAGYQPTDGTAPPPVDPADGFPDDGYPGSYAADLAQRYGLRLVDLACPGETTSSFGTKPAQSACASFYDDWLGEPDQEQAALRFLDLHPGRVALLTIDIGANDLDNCTRGSSVQFSCLAAGESDIDSQLPSLLATVRTRLAEDDPRARAVAMDYYDPFLALSYSPGGVEATAEAAASSSGVATLNSTVTTIDARHGVLTARVAKAFHTSSVLPLTLYGGQRLPRNVATICRLTWMCPLPGASDQQANIHPRLAGYRTIAAAFEAVLKAHGIRP